MSFTVIYSNKVLSEDVPFITSAMAERIKTAIEQKLTVDPMRFGKPLRHSWKGHRRLRVGDYRIIDRLDVSKRIVSIVTIGHRSGIYE
jgi:mRNA interferase RelE/StbE